MSSARFQLFVKAASEGKHKLGDCPFSQRAYMAMLLKVADTDIQLHPIDLSDKPSDFLAISPEGKVPVLKDTEADKTIDDSGAIVKYVDSLFPKPDLHIGYQGPAVDCTSQIFPKLAQLVKNKDPSLTPQLKLALSAELEKLNEYLKSSEKEGQFLLGDALSDLDCSMLPKLNHVRVAGKEWKNYNIDKSLTALWHYFEVGRKTDAWIKTCPDDEEIKLGWGRHGLLKED